VDNRQDIQGNLFRSPTSLLRGPAAYQPRTPWGAASALLATFLIVAASVGVAAGLVVWLGAGMEGPVDLPGRGLARGEATAAMRIFALWQVSVVALVILAATRGGVRNVLSLHPVPGGWRTLVLAVLLLWVLQIGFTAFQHVIIRHDITADLRVFYELIRGPDWLLTAAVIGLGAAFSEELLFRGFLQSALARTGLGFWGAAAITTGLWTALHMGYSAVGIIDVFMMGLFFSWLLWRTGSLWVTIFCHALYNSLIVLALRFIDLPAPT
jgi:membrane protease YdiL (CAAX protease family)